MLLHISSIALVLDAFTDPVWIGIWVAIIFGSATVASTVAITIWAVRKQRNRKEIAYAIISDTPILSIGKEVEGRVEIRFDNRQISDLRLTILRVWNAGNVPIIPNDFIETLRFEFGEKSEVLDVDLLETEPINLKPSFTRDQRSVTLEPLLLNSKDSIKIKVLLTGLKGKITANARIVGVSDIIEPSQNEEVPLQLAYYETVSKRKALLEKIHRHNLGAGRKMQILTTYIFSLFLDMLSGYGYRPGRIVIWYMLTLSGFALAYYLVGNVQYLPDALVFSLTSFHGRGFFLGLGNETSLHNPLVILSALEAVVGLLIEISFVATFTRRFLER